ncbi:hypothetical protein [Novosphingobium sp. BW1]|uniref:hypothetical protein n=1 Tax=Novosphingobium sp. BW1 TaxID=2592621 RepID=UPI0011DEC616|nr:hypothetical protein [Novosphingobium sp. BW1]TYC94763.1 hypothetical protein FMM79_00650 [Novosphingobium sp. BW1]
MQWIFRRLGSFALATIALLLAPAASARVEVSFYSVQTSLTSLRSVHAFFTLKGTLDADGTVIDENYGFSAKNSSIGFLFHPVKQTMLIEKQDYIDRANYHFSVPISDETYHEIIAEVQTWWHDPEYLWDIDERNCVTFVGVVAQMSGLKVDFPKKMMRKPKTYLTHIGSLNPAVLALQDAPGKSNN